MEPTQVQQFLQDNNSLLSSVTASELVNAAAQVNSVIWARCYRTLQGKPMKFVDFDNPFFHRPFLEMPLMMEAKHKTAIKPRQIGFTEISWIHNSFFIRKKYLG